MNQFVIFKNASDSLTAVPVETVSPLELSLILKVGGALVDVDNLPLATLYPRGTPFLYDALETPCQSTTIPALAED